MIETYTFGATKMAQQIEVPEQNIKTVRLFEKKTEEQLKEEEEEAKYVKIIIGSNYKKSFTF